MAEDQRKTEANRSWALNPIGDGSTPWLWIVHTTTVKDVGLPTETTEHHWECEVRFKNPGQNQEKQRKVVIVEATDQATFDSQLNDLRLAVVDARTWVQAGGT